MISGIHNSIGDYTSDIFRVKEVFLNHFKQSWFQYDNLGIIEHPFIHSEISLSWNEKLIKPILYIEIDEALHNLHPNKVPRFDEFPPFFF